MRIAIIVPFLNEERYLPALLESLSVQARRPDRVILIDDGSTDRSYELAAAWAARHANVDVMRRTPRPRQRDRLAAAHELQAFRAALPQLGRGYDLIGKLDADLRLTPRVLAAIEEAFVRNPSLGIAGAFLSAASGPHIVRERSPAHHVRGATKFYRRDCLTAVSPIPPILGWDTIDEARARMHGWDTASISVPGGDPVQMRPTGSYDGILRAFRRHGECAYGYGAHPLQVALGALRRLKERPIVLGGLSYLAGWILAAVYRRPRAEPELRAYLRSEQLRRIRGWKRPQISIVRRSRAYRPHDSDRA